MRSTGMTAVHVIARLLLGVWVTVAPLQGSTARLTVFAAVVLIALLWAGLDGIVDARRHLLAEDRADLVMRWTITGLITGVVGGLLCWLLDRAGIALPRAFMGVTSESPNTLSAMEGELVVVVADGAASLTPRAPVPEDPRGVDLNARLTAWLRTGGDLPDPGREVANEVGWWSRPVWLLLAEAVAGRQPNATDSWAPFGVGYHHAVWDAVPRPAEYRSGAAG